jgi:superfamily I DNA/RNA helicase
MSELNPSQKVIAETLDGMIVVDAGPGTGKTHTIVDRYVNILKKEDIDTKDVLLLTFTRNAAAEMKDRLMDKMSGTDLAESAKFVQTGTFDSLCYSVVMESPDSISRFFRMEERLTRGASLVENDTLNRTYFEDFFDRFMADHGEDYGNHSAVASRNVNDLYNVINRLMSRGVVPLRNGWFGGNDGKILKGDPDKVNGNLIAVVDKEIAKDFYKKFENEPPFSGLGTLSPEEIRPELLKEAADDDRTLFLDMVHDVYYGFIRQSVMDDHLTYGLVSTFAFIVLYTDDKVRERMSCRYLMVDEFQDTNENQLMITLMLLKEPNLCVVGDWKQGIYGFRYAEIENILEFEERVVRQRRILNDDKKRIPFQIPEVQTLSLDTNYRSSQKIIDTAFRSLYIQVGKERLDLEALDSSVTRIQAGREDIGENTLVEYVSTDSKADEATEVMHRIVKYVTDPAYIINDKDGPRSPNYGDIAVLCRNSAMCIAINDAAADCRIPAFLQGEVGVMSTREGKLALAWLRYINNRNDAWGIGTILTDRGYPLSEIRRILKGEVPEEFNILRIKLKKKKRRITDLLTEIFVICGLNNDLTQTIISTISSSHRSSLITISDVIGMMEKDIERNTKYSVDGVLDRKAVTIQTMHKSKGLEYPIVIIAGIDLMSMPSTQPDRGEYIFNDTVGLRSRKCVEEFGEGYSKITASWKTWLAGKSVQREFGDERRLMFVAVSRAKQYITMISGPKPSPFFDTLSQGKVQVPGEGKPTAPATVDLFHVADRPTVDEFAKRRTNIGVHEILRFTGDHQPEDGCDEFCGKGMEYGTDVHNAAHTLFLKKTPKTDYPELPAIKNILASVDDAYKVYAEKECLLPFNGLNATLKGVIDLIAVYPDRVIIHDYKTDAERFYLDEYKIQLSVYAHAASGFYKLPAKCIVDYISRDETVEFDPLPLETIAERVKDYIGQ